METNTTKKAGRPKKAVQNKVDNVKNEEVKEVKAKEVKRKEKLKLDDSIELEVKSNVFGQLIYINHKTGDETIWDNQGDIQVVTARDLKDMKAKQKAFYENNWISIVGSPDIDEDEYSVADIYDALQVTRYYKDYNIPEDLDEVFSWSVNELEEKLLKMPTSIRETIAIRANEKIKDGTLDSISKIKTIEEVLGCELASPED